MRGVVNFNFMQEEKIVGEGGKRERGVRGGDAVYNGSERGRSIQRRSESVNVRKDNTGCINGEPRLLGLVSILIRKGRIDGEG